MAGLPSPSAPPGARPPALIRMLPRRLVSRFMGQVGRLQPPAFLLQPILRRYMAHFHVNEEELARPLETYRSFLQFFTRPLKPGARRMDPDPQVIASPADGVVQQSGDIRQGRLLQVKGVTYPVAALLGNDAAARTFEGGSFLTVYLSPGDYHRFHWCFDATLTGIRHIPGDLWPVNHAAVQGVPGLFARNERAAILGKTRSGHDFAYVPVGALNVGSIRLACHPLRTNRMRPAIPRAYDLPSIEVRRGSECGHFEFGSSIVLLLAPGGGRFDPLPPETPLRVGQRVGHS